MSQPTTTKNRQKQRRKNLKALQDKAIKGIAGEKKMDQGAIFAAYRDPQNQMYQEVHQKVADLESKLTGLTFGAVQRYAFNKAGVSSVKALKKELTRQGISYADVPEHVLIELVALDDWASIARAAWPYIQKYGAPVLSYLYNQYVKPRVDKWMGGDEGINPADWGGVLGPRRFTPAMGENMQMSGVRNVQSNVSTYNTVDGRSIKSMIAPEFCKYRYTFTQMMKTAIATITSEYTVVANATGQVGVLFFPFCPTQTGAAYNSSYGLIYNDSTFNVTSGTQTPSATFLAGPLSTLSASVEQIRPTNFALQVIPTASFNSAGSFTLSYKNRSASPYSATSMGTTLAQAKVWPYTTSFNNKTLVRMTTVTGENSDDDFMLFNMGSTYHTFALLGSGLTPSTEACKIVITAIVEFIPTVAAFPICAMDYPAPGPLTEQFESMIYARFPVLQQLDLVDAKRIADGIPESSTNFDVLLSILTELLTGLQPRQYHPHSIADNIDMNASLPELIAE